MKGCGSLANLNDIYILFRPSHCQANIVQEDNCTFSVYLLLLDIII